MGDMADMVNDEDDLLEGFDLPAGLDDLPTLPANPAEELAQMMGGDGTELDQRMEVQRPYFDPDEPALQSFAVTGDTYPIKQALKTLGCRWNGVAWIAPDAKTFKQACDVRDAHHKRLHGQKPKRCATVVQPTLPRGPVNPPLGYAQQSPPPPNPAVQAWVQQVTATKPVRKRLPKEVEMSPDAIIAGMDELMGARQKGAPRPEPFDHNVDVDEQRRRSQQGQIAGALKRASDLQLAEELAARGYTVEKRSERSLIAESVAREGLSLEDADAAFEELEK